MRTSAPDNPALRRYVRKSRRSVSGWLSRIDGAIFELILRLQCEHSLGGGAAEIGLHHGKSFVAICLGLAPGERAYGIDIFERQDLNRDRSGRGSRETLLANLARFKIETGQVVIDDRSSAEVVAEDILDAVGPVRFFSIDGGHWLDIVCNDLDLAERTLADHGVIALDDFHRHEWPEVSAGYFRWFDRRTRPLVPVAIGVNKLYLSLESHAGRYTDAIISDRFLGSLVRKQCDFQGRRVPVLSRVVLPDDRLRARLRDYVITTHPDLYASLIRMGLR